MDFIKASNTVFGMTTSGYKKGSEIVLIVAKNRTAGIAGKTRFRGPDPNLISYYLPFVQGYK